MNLFSPIIDRVNIPQKSVKDTPTEKLYDDFIGILCGARGIVEVNKLVRSDPGLQQAFGRKRCAQQSVIQETLDTSTSDTVEQMESAINEIYHRHAQGYRHDYSAEIQILDADMSGQPCGPKAAFATKGYFAKQRNRRGRVLASRYNEIVAERVFEGKTQLARALQPLIQATEQTLGTGQSPEKRARTLLRIDSGGGTQADVNWLLN